MSDVPYPGEAAVKEVVEQSLGLNCDIALGKPCRADFDAQAGDRNQEVEIDFLIPFGKTCIVGEHTSEKSRKGVKSHFTKLAKKIEFLQAIPSGSRFTPFNIPTKRQEAYDGVEKLTGCLIYSSEGHRKPIRSTYSEIVMLSNSDWDQVKHYAECLGPDGKYHFLDSLGLSLQDLAEHSSGGKHETRNLTKDQYLYLGKRTVSQGFPKADVYVFSLEPSALVPISRVLRRDSLPALFDPMNPDRVPKYQRVLIKKKLKELRELIGDVGAHFVFPTAILALLSPQCHVDSTNGALVLPKEFGSLEIIDGQHRLFAYATDDLSCEKEKSTLVIIGVKFDDCASEDAQSWAARMFIDINTKQTRVRRDLQLIISYELGQQDPGALAAGMLLKLNDSGPLENRLNVGATSPRDSIKINTIVTRLRPLFDLKRLRKGTSKDRNKRLKLLEASKEIFVEGNEYDFVDAMTKCFRKFFVKVMQKFEADWKSPTESALMSAKYFAALADCLGTLIKEGRKWEQVDKWLDRVSLLSAHLDLIFSEFPIPVGLMDLPGWLRRVQQCGSAVSCTTIIWRGRMARQCPLRYAVMG